MASSQRRSSNYGQPVVTNLRKPRPPENHVQSVPPNPRNLRAMNHPSSQDGGSRTYAEYDSCYGMPTPFDKSRPWAEPSNSSSRVHMRNPQPQQFMSDQLDQPMLRPANSPQPEMPIRNALESRPSHARRSRNGLRKGRGVLKGYAVAKKIRDNEDEKLSISFSKRLGGAVGINRRSFVDEIGVQVRQHAPLVGVVKWSEVPIQIKNVIKQKILGPVEGGILELLLSSNPQGHLANLI